MVLSVNLSKGILLFCFVIKMSWLVVVPISSELFLILFEVLCLVFVVEIMVETIGEISSFLCDQMMKTSSLNLN